MGNGCGTQNIAQAQKSVFDESLKTVNLALGEIIEVSHNTRLFRFILPEEHTLGLPVGRHIQIEAEINGEIIKRSYTPTTIDSTIGYFDLIIKIYLPNETFPDGGLMSQYLNSLTTGDRVKVIGPRGKIIYQAHGVFKHLTKNTSIKTKQILMVAGGTGITPMLQIIRDIAKDNHDKTKVWLIFANKTEDDILCRTELDSFADDPRFTIHYTLTRPNNDSEKKWKGKIGRVNEEMISECFPLPTKDTVILLCGPTPMVKAACLPNLEKLKYNICETFIF